MTTMDGASSLGDATTGSGGGATTGSPTSSGGLSTGVLLDADADASVELPVGPPSQEAVEAAADLRKRKQLPPELLARMASDNALRLGKYEVRGWIGRGGMGLVLRGFDPHLRREVALKVLVGAGDEAVQRLLREAQALARINHPHVVEVHGFYAHEGIPFLAMELVQGASLDAVLRERGPLCEDEAWRLLEQAGGALAFAEGLGLVHRDLKPSNILWDEQQQAYRLCDFGLARVDELKSSLAGDSSNRLVGSLPYMSPEQRLLQPLDARSDMYSLGVTLYQLLTGVLPDAPAHDRLDPRSARPALSSALGGVVARLTRRARDERPYSWRDVLEIVNEGTRVGRLPEGEDPFILVPGGTYPIGHEGVEAYLQEWPRVEVDLGAFKIARRLFTHRELLDLVTSRPSDPFFQRWRDPATQQRLRESPDAPVADVTWAEADGLAKKAGGRLPRRLEWEVFCRSTLQSDPKTPQLFDWQEWTDDWFDVELLRRLQKATERAVDPQGSPARRDRRVVVGSGERSALPRRPSFHLGYPPEVRRPDLGFRIVLPPQEAR